VGRGAASREQDAKPEVARVDPKPIAAASAANAGGFLQTSLSEVTRRTDVDHAPAVSSRVTPDKVLAFIDTYLVNFPKRTSGARRNRRESGWMKPVHSYLPVSGFINKISWLMPAKSRRAFIRSKQLLGVSQ
jgi:hypothetical protein